MAIHGDKQLVTPWMAPKVKQLSHQSDAKKFLKLEICQQIFRPLVLQKISIENIPQEKMRCKKYQQD